MAQKVSRKKSYPDLHGIVLLDKPKGISSNQALQKVRHLFQAKKAGHTGNLDPMATGLLPCCFGDATKVAHLLINSDKTYIARCVLGKQTDTGDATGKTVAEHVVTALSDEEIKAATQRFTGEIEQIPPMYSALNHNGQRLYKLARQGKEVERPARKVTVHSFKMIDNAANYIDFEIRVSKGTYIRTLLEDFAKDCGTVAHMSALHRTQSGIISGQHMKTLDELQALNNRSQYIMPMDAVLIEYPRILLTKQQSQDLIHGKVVGHQGKQGLYRLYDDDHRFLGLGTVDQQQLKVKRLFLKSYLAIKNKSAIS